MNSPRGSSLLGVAAAVTTLAGLAAFGLVQHRRRAAIAFGALSSEQQQRLLRAVTLLQAFARGRLCRIQLRQTRRTVREAPVCDELPPRESPQQEVGSSREPPARPAPEAAAAAAAAAAPEAPPAKAAEQQELCRAWVAQQRVGRGEVEAVGGWRAAWQPLFENMQPAQWPALIELSSDPLRAAPASSMVTVEAPPQPQAAGASASPKGERSVRRKSSDEGGAFRAYKLQARKRTAVVQRQQQQPVQLPQQQVGSSRDPPARPAAEEEAAAAETAEEEAAAEEIDMEKLLAQLSKNKNLLQPRDINSSVG
jgi:hypothetical protein